MNEQDEWLMCAESPLYFLDVYCQVYDATVRGWVPLKLWPAQARVVRALTNHRLVIVLKARQLGMTWLLIGFALWLMLFRPAATILLFSRRDDEAINLLDTRLKGMYQRLPAFLKAQAVGMDSKHEWRLSNGSAALAFPVTGGDSYTATFALVDEADLIPDLGKLLSAVKPTTDAGGQLVLLSRVDKDTPGSEFKNVYRAAKGKLNDWKPIFLPWTARPGRTQEWYDRIKRDIVARTTSEDELWEQYPASDTEALSPRTLSKRLAPKWLEKCYAPGQPQGIAPTGAPAIPDLVVFVAPRMGASYVVGADPAEGNPTSDDSAAVVLDEITGEECAVLRGKFEPSTFGAHLDTIGVWFNNARVLVERNNHGHAVLLHLRDHSNLERLAGLDNHPGWLSSSKGKSLLYDAAAEAFRDGTTLMHSFISYTQLASIDGSTLRAPEGLLDDVADAYALALVARTLASSSGLGVSPLSDYRG